jgi:DNA-binding SARP family transcriptional activator/Mg2+ and Co2+ transporter CorA
MIRIVSPAQAVWIDLGARTERILEPGDHRLEAASDGFLWVDLELPAPEALDALRAAGVVPEVVVSEDESSGRVEWTAAPDHLHLSLAGTRLEAGGLALDRRHVVVTDGAVVSLHRGLPGLFEELRTRYRTGLERYARTAGFLIYEMAGHLADGHQRTVRALGDRVDELRLSAAAGAGAGADGSELLASLLVLRRILVGTRDLLVEISSRRSPLVPETTQPFLRDIAGRLDGLVADLAFSRDVLDEALRAAPSRGGVRADPATADTATRRPAARPGLEVRSLGGLEVRRGGVAVDPSELGGERARELLAALLAARRPIQREQLVRWLWPDLPRDQGGRALTDAVAALRRALAEDVVVADGSALRIALGPGDAWDVDALLGLDVGELPAERRIEELEAAVRAYGSPFCPEWPHAEWARAVREDQARALVRLRLGLADELLAAGRVDEATAYFERVVGEDPEDEAAHRGLMRCHARAGQTSLALRQFHACRSVLRQTQGAEPSPETQALYLEILGRR